MPALRCPECGSDRLWKDGVRKTNYGDVQRWLCRDCGFRFSHSPLKEKSWQQISRSSGIGFTCQIGATPKAHGLVRNLAKVEPLRERPAGATKTTEADIKGKIVEFSWWLKKEGYREGTILTKTKTLKILSKRGADLFDGESVKEVIARQKWSENTKLNAVVSYKSFAEFIGMPFNPPRYRGTRKLPFIPLEKEIDQLIAGTGSKTATFLQLLKETGMRCGEAWNLKWLDVNFENRTVTVNNPEKHGNPRMLKISDKLITMLNSLPKNCDRVFEAKSLRSFRQNFMIQRKRIAQKLGNPRIRRISFHTFRHWKATMEYHKTKDILHVKQMLGHKKIENTMMYTQLISFESDQFHVRTAKTLKEACKLVEAGFEYVTDMDNCKIFSKRK